VKIKDIVTETTAGGIAVVAQPLGAVIKRPNPSIYKVKKKRSPKTKNEEKTTK
jgi:hypothetical protein